MWNLKSGGEQWKRMCSVHRWSYTILYVMWRSKDGGDHKQLWWSVARPLLSWEKADMKENLAGSSAWVSLKEVVANFFFFFWNRICPHLQTMMNVNVFVKQFILRFFLWNRTCTLWIPVYFFVSPLTVRMYTISPSRHHSLRKNRRGFFFFFQFLACDVWCTWSPIKTIFFSSNSSSAAVFSIPKKICSRVRFYQICTRVHQIVICSIWVKTHSAKSPCHWYFMYHGVYSISCPFRFDTVLLDSSFPVSQLNARDITP